jgi:putative addiction module component (TIGR02574 family)
MENDNLLDEIDPWEDEAFLKELQSRIDDIESGKTKGISWEEVTRRAESELKKRRNNVK